jgi:integrase
MTKNKELLELKKQVDVQKKELGLTSPRFSYRFDSRTRKLILCYRIPQMVNVKGVPKIRTKRIEKYQPEILENNWKKYFKDETTIVKDHSILVSKEIELAEKSFNNYQDEYDFGWWKESFLSRRVGKTTSIKTLSQATIKQNTHHLNEYYDWCLEHHKDSSEMSFHIDNAPEWFEEYYTMRLTGEYVNPKSKSKWSPSTIGIAYRNIRGFYNYVADRSKGKFPYDILKRLHIPKSENLRDMVNPTEFEKIIDFISKNKDNVFWGKFILMLRLQLKTGMRVGELVSIRNRNIDEDDKCIWISGKTGRRRQNFNTKDDEVIWEDILNKKGKGIYLFHRTKIHYNRYKKEYYGEVSVDENKPTTESYYLQRFRQMREELGLRGKGIISSHSLRRYFITRFVSETKNRDLVRQIVGHSSTRMTDYYVGNMIESETETTISIGV